MQNLLGLMNRPHLKTLLLIFVVALLLRGLLFVMVSSEPERVLRRDADTYLQPALSVLAGEGFSQKNKPPFIPDVRRTPVYPLFIAAIYGVAGQNPLAVAAVQVLISAAVAGLTYLLGRQLVADEEANLSGWLVALSLTSIVYAVVILTETLFTLLFLAMNLAFLHYRMNRQSGWLVIAGGLAGLSILCRPVAFFYPFLLVPLLFFFVDGNWRRRAQVAILLLLTTFVVIAPWIIRNYRIIGIPTISTISSFNLLFYNAISLESELQGVGESQLRGEMFKKVDTTLNTPNILHGLDDASAVRLYNAWARDIILAHPFLYVYLHLKSDLNSLLPSITEFFELLGVTQGGKGTLSVLNQHGLIAATQHYFGDKVWVIGLVLPLLALLGLTYLGAVIGVGLLIRRKDWFTLFLLLMPLLYFLLLPGAPSHPRFRVPVMPYLCLLAGIGLWHLWWLVRQKKKLNS